MKILKIGFLIALSLFISFKTNRTFANNYQETKKSVNYDEERKIFDLVNRERSKKGFGNLIWNSKLAELARSYSEKMARERFFSHFERNGIDVAGRAKNIKWRLIGENLFMGDGYEKIEQIAVKGWMKSPTHRDNILEGKFNETGIGLARSRDGMIYITQVFIQN